MNRQTEIMDETETNESASEVSVTPSRKQKIYDQSFRDDWMLDPLLKDWLQRYENDRSVPYCKICDHNFSVCHKKGLIKHQATQKHIKNREKILEKEREKLESQIERFNQRLSGKTSMLSSVRSVTTNNLPDEKTQENLRTPKLTGKQRKSTGQDQENEEAVAEEEGVDENEETALEENPDEDDGEDRERPTLIEKQEVMQFDTSEEFDSIFGSKREFDSWEEYSKVLEEFQIKTGTSFKPRAAVRVDYANEKRVKGQIPERFVYSNVRMICQHFGPGKPQKNGQRRNYVGSGCEAFMVVSYNKGVMRVTNGHHIHSGHQPFDDDERRPIRVYKFDEDLDMTIAREVLRVNPYESPYGEKQWQVAVDRLGNNERLFGVTSQVVKKRIRFLISQFLAISKGRKPSPEDEMGCILYELDRSKREAVDVPGEKRKWKKSGRGRPIKKQSYDEDVGERSRKEPSDNEDFGDDDDFIEASTPKRTEPAIPAPSSYPTSDMTSLISYLCKKDEEDRRLRHRELELRREELSFQEKRFDFERIERKALLDLLKADQKQQAAKTATSKGGSQVEYTIVVDENNQVINSVPALG